MLRQQTWIKNSDAFDYISTNMQRVLKLSTQYENYPYIEKFTREYSFVFMYKTCFRRGGR